MQDRLKTIIPDFNKQSENMKGKIDRLIISSTKPEEIGFIKSLLTMENLSTVGVEKHLKNFLTLYLDGLILFGS